MIMVKTNAFLKGTALSAVSASAVMGCTFLKFEHLSALFGLVHCLTSHGLVKIHKPSVELGAVDAGELYLISHMNTACTAHSGTVYHDRVHGYDGRDLKLFGKLNCKFHHDEGTDRDTSVIFLAFIYKGLETYADITVSAVRTVIGCNIYIVSNCFEIILKNDKILIPCTDDYISGSAGTPCSLSHLSWG